MSFPKDSFKSGSLHKVSTNWEGRWVVDELTETNPRFDGIGAHRIAVHDDASDITCVRGGRRLRNCGCGRPNVR